jgi:mono/diheme cytochrome c family protein
MNPFAQPQVRPILQRVTRYLILLMAALLPLSGVVVSNMALASPATLELKRDGQRWQFTAADLLDRQDTASISIPADVAYKRAMQFRALPLASLLRENGFTAQGTLNVLALDGFAAPLDAALVLNANAAQPWLAVEVPGQPWPALSPDGSSAGPFYLVWVAGGGGNASAAGVPQEHWPYQIAVIEQTVAPEQRYPQILPDAALPKQHPAWKGLALFKTHCIACHQINGGGDGVLGPDLNLPHNPTEYFAGPFLKRLIRDPAQVRSWRGMKMPGFDTNSLSDQELDALLAYLRVMAGRR